MNSDIKSLPSVQLLGMIDLGVCPAVFENLTDAFLAPGRATGFFCLCRIHYSSNTPPPFSQTAPLRGYLVTPPHPPQKPVLALYWPE
ncbi:MAG TPA: hypothetical protein VK699_21415, partial [Terriglobales bacterium]|nr:hypothetical protein [Terriglobales bacterium]